MMFLLNIIKKYKFVLSAIVIAVIAILIIIGVYSVDSSSNDMLVNYLTQMGWQVEPKPVEISHFVVPKTFDSVYSTYNELQIESGFNLEEYRGQNVTRYSYRILNHVYSNDDYVRANIIVYKDKIIGGDICSNSLNGFMHALNDTVNKQ